MKKWYYSTFQSKSTLSSLLHVHTCIHFVCTLLIYMNSNFCSHNSRTFLSLLSIFHWITVKTLLPFISRPINFYSPTQAKQPTVNIQSLFLFHYHYLPLQLSMFHLSKKPDLSSFSVCTVL